MVNTSIKPINLAEELDRVTKQRETGELILKSYTQVGKLHFCYGRLLYATSDFHPVRRWHRSLKKYCPNWVPESLTKSSKNPWEYQLLYQGITQKQLNITQAKAVIRNVTQEVLCDLGSLADLTVNWEPRQKTNSNLSLGLTLSSLEMDLVISEAAQMQQQWKKAGLGKIRPNLAPILQQQADLQELSNLNKYLKGNPTLWDLACHLQKPVHSVTRALIPWVKKGMVQFKKIPDLPIPTFKQPATLSESPLPESKLSKSSGRERLIACIDDSPLIAQILKAILEPVGYKILIIQEPMRGIAQLAEHQPELIFLDLIMPNVNGYNVCQFLRSTPMFKDTPIIVLTGENSRMNRNRAKLVGASNFLSKPPQNEQVLEMIEQYIRD
ncbi:MAG: response regulator [Moorea sp. SIO2B7]|nr:response regulator [Moorena sp. SIO2B7]